MSRFRLVVYKLFITALALSILVGAVYVAFYTFRFLLLDPALDDNVRVAILSGIATIAGIVIANMYTRRRERERIIEEEQRRQRFELYSDYITFWHSVLVGATAGKKPKKAPDATDYFAKLLPRFALWAPDVVLRQHTALMTTFSKNSDTPNLHLVNVELEKLLRLMREDLGHKNEGLEAGYVWLPLLLMDTMDSDSLLKKAADGGQS